MSVSKEEAERSSRELHESTERNRRLVMGDDIQQSAPYGYCPFPNCGQVLSRERRPNGNDVCPQGHEYPSSENAGLQQERPVPSIQPYPKFDPGLADHFTPSRLDAIIFGRYIIIPEHMMKIDKLSDKAIRLTCYIDSDPEWKLVLLEYLGTSSAAQVLAGYREYAESLGYTVV